MIRRRASVSGLVFTSFVALASTVLMPRFADARSTPAIIGYAEDGDPAACVKMASLGSLYNACPSSGLRFVRFPLPIDSSGSKSVVVNAQGPVSCRPAGLDKNGSGVFAAQSVWSSGSPLDLTLVSVSVPSNGVLTVQCALDPNGQVNTLRW